MISNDMYFSSPLSMCLLHQEIDHFISILTISVCIFIDDEDDQENSKFSHTRCVFMCVWIFFHDEVLVQFNLLIEFRREA